MRIRLATFVLVMSLFGMTHLDAQTGGGSSSQFKAQLEAIAAGIKTQLARAKQLSNEADSLLRQINAIRRERVEKQRSLHVLLAQIEKLKASLPPQKSNTSGVTHEELAKMEEKARQAQMEADKLMEELALLLQQHTDIEKRLKEADDKIAAAIPAKEIASRTKADLEEDLARAKQALSEAEKNRNLQLQNLKVLREKIGDIASPLDNTKGRTATSLWKPKETLLFVCRKQKIVLFESAPLFQRFASELQSIVKDVQRPTWDLVATRVNALNLENSVSTLRVRAINNGCILMQRMKYGDEWESAEKISDEQSSFRKKLMSVDKTSTGVVFIVWQDSFDTYIRAVSITKKAGFRTNWTPYSEDDEINIRFPIGGNSDGIKFEELSHGSGGVK